MAGCGNPMVFKLLLNLFQAVLLQVYQPERYGLIFLLIGVCVCVFVCLCVYWSACV